MGESLWKQCRCGRKYLQTLVTVLKDVYINIRRTFVEDVKENNNALALMTGEEENESESGVAAKKKRRKSAAARNNGAGVIA